MPTRGNWNTITVPALFPRALFRHVGFACLLGLLFATVAGAQQPTPNTTANKKDDRPNILVFIGDDLGQRDYGCYGNKGIRTPQIDALAKAGMLFHQAFLTTSSCSPSRISILTGRYPHQTGAEDLHMRLPADQIFVSSLLREAGYFTGHMFKTHYGPNGNRQFDWYADNLDEFPRFLDEKGPRPFFLWVGFHEAHRPYKQGTLQPPHDPAQVTVPPYLADTPETRADLALYYDEIGLMDQKIGTMLAELARRGLAENTIIVFIGDNGMPFPRAKGTVYASGIGTPLVIRWPRVVPAGTQTSSLTSVIDLAPTFLAAAGIAQPASMVGRSLLPLLRDPQQPGREFIFAERNWHNADEHIRTVRTRQYALIRNAYLDLPYGNPSDVSGSASWQSLLKLKAAGQLTPAQSVMFQAPRPLLEFYDLERDPHELHNLAGAPEHAETVRRLTAQLDAWQAETKDFSPEVRRRADNVNRVTGDKFTSRIGPHTDGPPEPLPPEAPLKKGAKNAAGSN